MKKCAFVVSDWFIKKTKSHKPFLDLFKERYKVDIFEGLEWRTGVQNKNIFKKSYDLIIFFVRLPPANQLKLMECKNFVWIPMRDSLKGNLFVASKFITYLGLNLKVVCFSKELFNWLKCFFNCNYFQYYPKPCFKEKDFSKVNVLFWERRKEISVRTVLKLFDLRQVNCLTVRSCFDDGVDSKRVVCDKVKYVDGWFSDRKYLGLLDSHCVFVAPRVSEGIGFSFLNAMARGLVVVGNDSSTMNEYINNGVDGFLFDYKKPVGLDLGVGVLELVGRRMRGRFELGYLFWCKQKVCLLDWVG